ncbi:hypothetical protein SETIT_8G164000v2 [Setaria italica]|uniref:F-box domain-containing protein n=1 Tax=Setaria italica TaxID=4555 RepID=A0A368SA61_SETIT|nr:hypothetical protein SETIT_8G164000v2 [Setaria italica]
MDAGDGEDRISSLPDEVLHAIFISLSSPRAAVRTGVLSRRWHHVWTPLPELRLAEGVNAPLPQPLASFLDTVDAAWDTPTLKGLSIEPSAAYDRDFPARQDDGEEAVLELLACEGVTKICLRLHGAWRRLAPMPVPDGPEAMHQIVAPRLEKLSASISIDEARISAPKLAEVVWSNSTYDPRHHQFDDLWGRLGC